MLLSSRRRRCCLTVSPRRLRMSRVHREIAVRCTRCVYQALQCILAYLLTSIDIEHGSGREKRARDTRRSSARYFNDRANISEARHGNWIRRCGSGKHEAECATRRKNERKRWTVERRLPGEIPYTSCAPMVYPLFTGRADGSLHSLSTLAGAAPRVFPDAVNNEKKKSSGRGCASLANCTLCIYRSRLRAPRRKRNSWTPSEERATLRALNYEQILHFIRAVLCANAGELVSLFLYFFLFFFFVFFRRRKSWRQSIPGYPALVQKTAREAHDRARLPRDRFSLPLLRELLCLSRLILCIALMHRARRCVSLHRPGAFVITNYANPTLFIPRRAIISDQVTYRANWPLLRACDDVIVLNSIL